MIKNNTQPNIAWKLRQKTLLHNDAVGNWNLNQINILTLESRRQLNVQLDSRVLNLWSRKASVER